MLNNCYLENNVNIFVTDTDPVVCASHHCDRHEPKMILESAQMLCAVHHRYGSTFPGIYKLSHPNHPCTLWAGENTKNYFWLLDLFYALNRQRVARGKATHKSFRDLSGFLTKAPDGLPVSSERTPFAQAMPDKYKDEDATFAYRKYLLAKRDEWRERNMDFTYKDREIPHFMMYYEPALWDKRLRISL